jgi:hypothetical protein
MGRIIAFLLGGLALALYAPHVFMTEDQLKQWTAWLTESIGSGWYQKIFEHGPGIFAGLALILFAVRGREGGD